MTDGPGRFKRPRAGLFRRKRRRTAFVPGSRSSVGRAGVGPGRFPRTERLGAVAASARYGHREHRGDSAASRPRRAVRQRTEVDRQPGVLLGQGDRRGRHRRVGRVLGAGRRQPRDSRTLRRTVAGRTGPDGRRGHPRRPDDHAAELLPLLRARLGGLGRRHRAVGPEGETPRRVGGEPPRRPPPRVGPGVRHGPLLAGGGLLRDGSGLGRRRGRGPRRRRLRRAEEQARARRPDAVGPRRGRRTRSATTSD